MGKARGLALLAALLLAGCGGSSKSQPSGTLRLGLPLVPRQLDPAKAPDLPSLNVAHELYAGLTRYSGKGVEPDLAQSWDVSRGGLVWTFHLRKGLLWSDDTPVTAQDVARSWRRALDPATRAPYAGPYLGIVRGARRFHATGHGSLGVRALDDRTLRVTLQHPVPWFDQLVAHPVTAPVKGGLVSGPFRLASQSSSRLVLERNFQYWNAQAVRPSRIVLGRSGADGELPRGLAAPGLPWVQTSASRSGRRLPLLAIELLWFVTNRPGLDSGTRQVIAGAVGDPTLTRLVPGAMPGRGAITSGRYLAARGPIGPTRLRLAYTTQDALAPALVRRITSRLAAKRVTVEPVPFSTLAQLVQAAGPPARPDLDLVLLGWSSKLFDAYNLFDLFPCGSAFNVAQWCDPGYDALMRRTVRALDDGARRRLEHQVLEKLGEAMPAVPVAQPSERVRLSPGVRGFSWSPIGFYELSGMTRS